MKKQSDYNSKFASMKLILMMSVLLLTSTSSLFAQNDYPSKFKVKYWSIGGEINGAFPTNVSGFPAWGTGIGGTLYFANNYVISVDYKFSEYFKAKNLPGDYRGGWDFIGSYGDIIKVSTISLGKMISPQQKSIRFTLQGGLSMMQYQAATFTENKCERLFCINLSGPNYHREYPEKEFGVGVNLRAKAELNYVRFVGLYFLTETNINKFQSYFSVGIGMHFGKLRE